MEETGVPGGNYSGVCLCDVMSSVKLGLHQGVAQLQQEGFSQTLRPKSLLRLSFQCGYLSGKYGTSCVPEERYH